MGCFNTIMVTCPHCGKRNDLPSKSGTCSMKVTPIEYADVQDIAPYHEESNTCLGCQKNFVIILQHMVSVIKYEDLEHEFDNNDD